MGWGGGRLSGQLSVVVGVLGLISVGNIKQYGVGVGDLVVSVLGLISVGDIKQYGVGGG